MDNNVFIFLHITLVTSLSTDDLTPNFSESIFTPSTSGIIYGAILLTVWLFWESLHNYPALGNSIAYKLPWWYNREMVLQNYRSLIF